MGPVSYTHLDVYKRQILSTRRDLVPTDIADELTLLQDRVQPFDGEAARDIVEASLGKPIDELFAHFDTTPLASASIAQVHAAVLDGGREVVVKVLRPGIRRQIDSDIALLYDIAGVIERTHPNADKIRPREVVAEVESTLAAELDLQREAGNASVLRRNWLGSADPVSYTHLDVYKRQPQGRAADDALPC